MNTSFEEALEYAKEKLSIIKELNLQKRAELKGKCLEIDDNLNEIYWPSIIEKAGESSEHFDILKLHCSNTLRSGYYIEPLLRNWLCDYLDGLIKEPKGNKGAPRKFFGREFFYG